MEAEQAGAVNSIESNKAFNKVPEHKKYRLRPINFSNENNIYKKYFQVSVAKWVSAFQIILGVTTVAAKLMEILLAQNLTWKTATHVFGSFGLSTLAASVSLSAAYRSSYCRLHSAMALHILNAVVQYIIVDRIFSIEIPSIQKEMGTELEEANAFDSEASRILCIRTGKNCTMELLQDLENREFNNIYGFYRVELILAGMISIYGILQIVLSTIVALMSGRAICCGRMSLERKFYEIESMGSEGPRVQRPVADPVDSSKIIFKRKESENSDTSLASLCHSPLPYGVTPRNSGDISEAAGITEQEEKKIVLQPPPNYTEK